jgi:hypothetical protein
MDQAGLPLRKNPNVRLTEFTRAVGFGLMLPPEIMPAIGISAMNTASPPSGSAAHEALMVGVKGRCEVMERAASSPRSSRPTGRHRPQVGVRALAYRRYVTDYVAAEAQGQARDMARAPSSSRGS